MTAATFTKVRSPYYFSDKIKQHDTQKRKTASTQGTGLPACSSKERGQEAKVYSMNESEDWGFGRVHETDPTFHRFPNTV